MPFCTRHNSENITCGELLARKQIRDCLDRCDADAAVEGDLHEISLTEMKKKGRNMASRLFDHVPGDVTAFKPSMERRPVLIMEYFGQRLFLDHPCKQQVRRRTGRRSCSKVHLGIPVGYLPL